MGGKIVSFGLGRRDAGCTGTRRDKAGVGKRVQEIDMGVEQLQGHKEARKTLGAKIIVRTKRKKTHRQN